MRKTGHRLYRVWIGMMRRCHYPSARHYGYYGGRGITVCKHWHTFENFVEDMWPDFKEGLQLDRKNNDKGYSKANCEWVDKTTQMNNCRSNIWIDTPSGKMTVSQAAKFIHVEELVGEDVIL
jgi:hypothetical protein